VINIAVWDNIGNVLLGVRLRGLADNPWPARLTTDDPAAAGVEARAAPLFEELFAGYEVRLHEVKTLAELEAIIGEVDYLVVHKERVPPEVLARGQRLRLVQHLGLDYRGAPMEAARALGVPVCATPLVNYNAVAEHAWALLLNHYKQMPAQRRQMEQRLYTQHGWGATVPQVRLLEDDTLGLLGFGEIARPMARYACAFGMRALYWDVARFPALEEAYGVEYAAWDQVFQRADVLSVHLPIKPETERIIGAREIGLMKPTALFINTARGKLVDQPALVKALQERRLGGAALDVFETEPLPEDDPLHALHEDPTANVTLTSHSAWQGPWTWVRDSLNIWHNVLRHLRGEPLRYVVG
jgi:phosphoglycerate dehydrogenase-like enzyme